MVAAAVTASALRTERTCDWLEELERIGDLAESLPADAARAVTRVVIGVLGEPTTTAEQCARALALLAAIDPDRPRPEPVPLRALAAAPSPVARLGLAS